jgi:FkbM family methyltransferase
VGSEVCPPQYPMTAANGAKRVAGLQRFGVPGEVNTLSNLVFDVGMHKGEDTAYYLAKGFRVVAIEADPELAQACRRRFAQEIARGQLDIIEGAIANGRGKVSFFKNEHSVWGSVHKDWADRNAMLGFKSNIIEVEIVDIKSVFQTFGVPFYLKLDIEGGEKIVLSELVSLPSRPHFISLESEKVYFRNLFLELRLLARLGYNRFKVVQQQTIPGSTVQTTDCDGRLMTYTFEDHSSGPFGDDACGEWLSYRQACFRYAIIFGLYRLFGDYGLLKRYELGLRLQQKLAHLSGKPIPGWYDTHAKRV